ncbi:MAG: TonB-dependent receptor [Pyrinomonadaceae bacterium]|nr:TonB-dependent receptor [Pyrinomonadaceae bacterium]
MAKSLFCSLTSIVLSMLITSAAYGQEVNRSITGTVRDLNGAVVVGAAVVASRAGQERSTTTDSQGTYSFPDLSPGKYRVTVTAQNFQTLSREVDLTNSESAADFQLAAGGVAAEVTISAATRYERSTEDLPLSVTVIPRREILNSPGQTIDDELRYVAGVNLQRDNADVIFPVNPSIAVRGLGVGDTATRSLVLLDGLPINGGFWGAVFWNRAPEYTIERLEVVRGSSSSLFGSFAMGGTVNIVTHAPEQRELNGELQYGENQRFRSSLQYGDVVANDRIAFSLNTNYYTTNGFFRVPENDRRPVDESEHAISKNFQGRSNFKFSDSARGFIRAGYYDQNRIGDHQLASTHVDLSDVAGGVDFDLNDSSVFSTRLFYSRENVLIDNVREVDDTTTFVSNSHDNEADIFGFSAQWSKAFSRTVSHLSLGVDFRRVDGTNNQDVFNSPNTLSAEILGGGTQTATGVFAEISLRPNSRSEILGSLRYDNFRDADGRIVTDGVTQAFPTRTINLVSPRLAARYQFIDQLALRGAYYEGFRAPTLAERYRSFESPTFRGLSNPELAAERLRGGEVGVDIRHGIFDGQVNYLYNRLNNFVGSAEVGFIDGKFTVMNTNIAKTRSQGVEIIGNLRFTDYLNFTGNYTFTDAEVITGPLTGNELEGAPRNVASLLLNYYAPFGLNLSPRARFVDDAFQDITHEAPMDRHFIFDFFASYRVHRNLDLFVVAENLFNKEYIADGFAQTLGAPRQVSVGIRFNLGRK